MSRRASTRSAGPNYSYDANNRLTLAVMTDGTTHSFAYDKVGNRTFMSDPSGTTTYSYTPRNELAGKALSIGRVLSYSYDAGGRRTQLAVNGVGSFTYEYDAKNQVTSVTNPQSHATSMQYDGLGRVTQREDAAGASTSLAYDAAGRMTTLLNEACGTTVSALSFAYDNVNNRTLQMELDGTVTSWAYDATNQLTREQRSGVNGFDISYAYDPAGNRAQRTDSTTRTTNGYNPANWLGTEVVTSYDWSDADVGGATPAGSSGLNIGSGAWTVKGGGSGLGSLRDEFHLAYQAAVASATLTMTARVIGFGGGTGATARAGVIFRGDTSATAPFAMMYEQPDNQVAFAWRTASGATGSATALTGGTSATKYLQVRQSAGGVYGGYYSTDGVTYTAVGTPVTLTLGSTTLLMGLAVTAGVTTGTTLATAAFDHVTFTPTIRTTTYGSDAAGNRTSVADSLGTSTYAFDALSQLTSQHPVAASGPAAMTYNGDGQRTRKAPSGEAAVNFIYDHNNLLQEVDDEDETLRVYTMTGGDGYGDLISEYQESGGGGEYYHQFDANANTNAIIDQSCSVPQQYRYQAFGLPIPSDGSGDGGFGGSSLLWGGQKGYYYDADTQLYLLGAGTTGRWYDPATGKFLSEDPTRHASGDNNLQRYVGNNPVNQVDPNGHDDGDRIATLRALAIQQFAQSMPGYDLRDKTLDQQIQYYNEHPDGPFAMQVNHAVDSLLGEGAEGLPLTLKPLGPPRPAPEHDGGRIGVKPHADQSVEVIPKPIPEKPPTNQAAAVSAVVARVQGAAEATVGVAGMSAGSGLVAGGITTLDPAMIFVGALIFMKSAEIGATGIRHIVSGYDGPPTASAGELTSKVLGKVGIPSVTANDMGAAVDLGGNAAIALDAAYNLPKLFRKPVGTVKDLPNHPASTSGDAPTAGEPAGASVRARPGVLAKTKQVGEPSVPAADDAAAPQRIVNKLNDADESLFRPKVLKDLSIKDGKLFVRGTALQTAGGPSVEFVVGNDGQLVFGSRHQYLAKVAGDKASVQAAGRMIVKSGKVTYVDNASGHFLPTEQEALRYPEILRKAGLDLKGAILRIYVADPSNASGARVAQEVILD